jgi:hypothetical protein
MEQLVEAIARPFATKLDGSASDVAYVLIATEVVYTSPTRSYEAAQKLLEDPTIPAITAELAELIDGDEQLVTERIIHGVRFISHAVADRARLQRAKSVRQSRLDLDAFTANLVDMVAASLTAPVSEATARALES